MVPIPKKLKLLSKWFENGRNFWYIQLKINSTFLISMIWGICLITFGYFVMHNEAFSRNLLMVKVSQKVNDSKIGGNGSMHSLSQLIIESVQLKGDTSQAFFLALGSLYARQGYDEDALQIWKQGKVSAYQVVNSQPSLRQEKDWKHDLDMFRLAVQLEPLQSEAWFFLGKANRDRNNFDIAIEDFLHASRLNNFNHISHIHSSDPYYEIGMLFLKDLKSDRDAEIYFNKALDVGDFGSQQENGLSYLYLADIAFRKHQWDNSLQYIEKAQSIAKFVDADILKARIYYWHKGKSRLAEELLLKVINEAPHYQNPYLELGKIFEDQKRCEDARKLYQQAYKRVNPDDKDIFLQLEKGVIDTCSG